MRHLPKPIWLLLMLMAPVLGGIAWRNPGERPAQPSPLPAQHAQSSSGQTLTQV